MKIINVENLYGNCRMLRGSLTNILRILEVWSSFYTWWTISVNNVSWNRKLYQRCFYSAVADRASVIQKRRQCAICCHELIGSWYENSNSPCLVGSVWKNEAVSPVDVAMVLGQSFSMKDRRSMMSVRRRFPKHLKGLAWRWTLANKTSSYQGPFDIQRTHASLLSISSIHFRLVITFSLTRKLCSCFQNRARMVFKPLIWECRRRQAKLMKRTLGIVSTERGF